MKPHFKKSKGMLCVFENRGDELPLIITHESCWSAMVDFKRFKYVCELMNNNPNKDK